ncbi:probable LRR receptor-like serine/threonine-protein kinase At3g47570 [Diospyros lotus]|uniref:probable LRR receptor-like serine/threonine-protein kinase At3g47570 n=1 Tax=Diospyros lotus TaxID=55363 RepID=UPI00224F66AB|nr:probable LRR receptor-like serine/threonine-protein kinase At3g47570 [Diospyros lotus]
MSSMRCYLPYIQTIFVLVVPILLQFRILLTVAAIWSGNTSDHLALLAFKSEIIHDPEGVMDSWNDSVHFCNWQGVMCGNRHQRVTILDLHARRLTGFISPYIGNLSFLRVLRLNNNSFQGEIPPQVGNLFRLQELSLYLNSLTGEIPANLSHCSNLLYFRIGTIPEALGQLQNLTFLSLDGNKLSDMVAYVGDFGLARLMLEMNPNQSNSVGVKGTIGYAAPEYGLGSEVSRDGGVYNFGILLLEMMTDKRPTESMFEVSLNLHTFARMAIPDHVMDIVDPKLLYNDEEEVVALTSNKKRRATTRQ